MKKNQVSNVFLPHYFSYLQMTHQKQDITFVQTVVHISCARELHNRNFVILRIVV